MIISRPRSRLDPAALRLPLIALIDVVLFLLMYFLLAGSLADEERQLAAALARESSGAVGGPARDFARQVVRVDMVSGAPAFRLGQRIVTERAALLEVLRSLPKGPGIVVQAADEVPVASVATALQVCHDAGFTSVSFSPAG